jgi:hypothetical protein
MQDKIIGNVKGDSMKTEGQIHIRFSKKPKGLLFDDCAFQEVEGLWANISNATLFGVKMNAENTWEAAWFVRNPDVLKMIECNDVKIAKKISKHERKEIRFLAEEILNGNNLTILDVI